MKINYRPEIDGLRAIAVIAVIFYHAQITIFGYQPFKGGFIGVDIFFVISGYLITSIILRELVTTGSFSFKYFYERRIRRILPVLLLVIIVSLPFAWLYLIPKNFIDYAKSILYSLGFISNIYFPISGQAYGDISSLLKPFLHTWSLSVEEQYYILFPVFLIISFRYFRRYFGFILASGFFISLGFAEYGSRNFEGFNFYLIPSRGWELLAGSLLAYFEVKFGHRKNNKTLVLILPGIGLLLIAHSIFFFNDRMNLPSLYSLSPIIGVCLLIWFTTKDEWVTKMLSSKFFVGIGLISYSLYLWHYPIFAFARIFDFTEGNIFKELSVGLIVFILSIMSYYFIERPVRNKNIKFKYIFLSIIFSYCVLIIINSNIIFKKGFENRYYSSDTYKFSNLEHKKLNDQFEKNYNYNNYDHRKNVLIVGNSHAEDMLQILSSTNLSDKIYFNLTSYDDKTLNFQARYLLKFLKDKKSLNTIYDENYLKQLTKQYNKSDLILIATYIDNEDIKILDELIKFLILDKKKIIIFNNGLVQKVKNSLNRLDYFVFKNKRLPDDSELKTIEQNLFKDLKKTNDINLRIKSIAKNNEIFLIEKKKILCDLINQKCPAVTDIGYKIYWDSEHITVEGSNFFAKKIEKDQTFLKYLNLSLNDVID